MVDTAELTSGLTVGEGVFYMKVGTHAGETIEEIVQRKQAEIERLGFAYWGYGGSNCHPLSIVQPFADELGVGGKFRLLMEETHAKHFGVDRLAGEYSEDGVHWNALPEGTKVKGSRYALVIEQLDWVKLTLPLSRTEVVIGPNSGRRGDHYVSGLVDKACLQVVDERSSQSNVAGKNITLAARIRKPFAVFLRERPELEGSGK